MFVGLQRVRRADERVRPGDVLQVAPPRASEDGRVAILLHEGDLVAADKPAGIPTIPDHGGASHALLAVVARTLGIDASRLHPTSRLDRDVSGVVVFALTAAARSASLTPASAALRTPLRRHASRSPGQAEGAGADLPDQLRATAALWDAPIGRDARSAPPGRRTVATPCLRRRAAQSSRVAPGRGAARGGSADRDAPTRSASTRARGRAARRGPRVRRSGPGHAAVGTRVRSRRASRCTPRASSVPAEDGAPLVAISPIPAELAELWSALGGDPAAWEGATSCVLS